MLCSIVTHSGAPTTSRLGSVGRFGSAIAVEAPAGHQRAMADGHAGQIAVRPACLRPVTTSPSRTNQLSLAPVTLRSSGAIGLPIEQTNDRPFAVGGAKLQGLSFPQLDRDRFDIDVAVDDLDHGIGRRVLFPVRQGIADVLEKGVPADLVDCGVRGLAQGAIVLAAADIGAEAIGIGDPHRLPPRLARREDDAAQHRVHRHLVADRPVAPVAEVGRNDPRSGYRRALRAAARPDHQALHGTVIERHARGGGAARLINFAPLERAAGNRQRQRRIGAGGFGVDKQWAIVAERAEQEAVGRLLLIAIGWRLRDGVGAQPPDEDADLGDVRGPAAMRAEVDPSHVDIARHLVEGGADQVERVAIAKFGGPASIHVKVVDVLSHREQAVELHRAGRPAAHRFGQVLQNRQRALAAAEADGVGHLATRHDDALARQGPSSRRALGQCADRRVADERADIGHDPVLARLDEPVFVEAGDVLFDHADLLGDDAQQRAQRRALIGVAQPVDDGDEIVEAVGVVHHRLSLTPLPETRSACRGCPAS